MEDPEKKEKKEKGQKYKKNEAWKNKRLEILKERKHFFPDIKDDDLWIGVEKTGTGYSMIPRSMPIIGMIMDDLSKGKPISSTYFALWCKDRFETKFLTIENPRECAIESKFCSSKQENTWTGRMRILKKIGFIQSKKGLFGEFSYVVIMNPYIILKGLYDKGKIIDEDKYDFLRMKARKIGAKEAEII